MLDEFLYRSGDLHSLCAYLVYKDIIPRDTKIEDIKKLFPKQRKEVKAIEFSQQFGGSEYAIMSALGCSLEEAQAFKKTYDEGFKGITEFKKKGSALVKKQGYIIMCKYTGHRLNWWDWDKWKKEQESYTSEFWDKYKEIKANNPLSPIVQEVKHHFQESSKYDRYVLNSPTQCTGVVIMKDAMIDFFKYLKKNNLLGIVLLCNLVHDEAVIEYPKNMPDMSKILEQCMENSAAKYCKSLPIPAIAEVDTHWVH